MNRREFVAVLAAGAAASPLIAQAQQTIPEIGFLHAGAAGPNARRVAGFRKGLAGAGLVEGRDVAIEFRWAEGDDVRLAEMATDLVQRRVAVIATLSSTIAAVAARKATATIPIYFLTADPPDRLGLVASLNRPGGNATGIVTLAAEVAAKRFSLLHELVSRPAGMALLVRPSHPSTKAVVESVGVAARSLGVSLDVLQADNDREIEEAYGTLAAGVPLMVGTDPLFFARRTRLIALAAERRAPSIYDSREYAEAGGLTSYGPNHVRLWEQAGAYVARILRGEKPSELPVAQATTFETVINLKVARTLGLAVPERLLALADEVID